MSRDPPLLRRSSSDKVVPPNTDSPSPETLALHSAAPGLRGVLAAPGRSPAEAGVRGGARRGSGASRGPGSTGEVGGPDSSGPPAGSHTFIYEAFLGLPEREAPPGSDPCPALSALQGRPWPQLQPPTGKATSKRWGRQAW